MKKRHVNADRQNLRANGSKVRGGYDQRLNGISFAAVAGKRDRDQALNMKELSVLSGLSYPATRACFQDPEFPRVGNVVFWSDFLLWRRRNLPVAKAPTPPTPTPAPIPTSIVKRASIPGLPARAQKILADCK